MPVYLAVPADEACIGESALQVLDQEILVLPQQDRHQPLVAGRDEHQAEGGLPGEVADLLAVVPRIRVVLLFRCHFATARFLWAR